MRRRTQTVKDMLYYVESPVLTDLRLTEDNCTDEDIEQYILCKIACYSKPDWERIDLTDTPGRKKRCLKKRREITKTSKCSERNEI